MVFPPPFWLNAQRGALGNVTHPHNHFFPSQCLNVVLEHYHPFLCLPFLMVHSLWNDVWTQVTSFGCVVRWKLRKECIVRSTSNMCYEVQAQSVLERRKSNWSRHNVCLGMRLVHLGTTCAQPKELLVGEGFDWFGHDMCSTKRIISHEVKRRFGWLGHDTCLIGRVIGHKIKKGFNWFRRNGFSVKRIVDHEVNREFNCWA